MSLTVKKMLPRMLPFSLSFCPPLFLCGAGCYNVFPPTVSLDNRNLSSGFVAWVDGQRCELWDWSRRTSCPLNGPWGPGSGRGVKG